MSTPDFAAATAFVAANARIIDRRRFERLFNEGSAEPVRDAVAAYRNDDGGFGNALEPDCRAPGSQPAAVDMALRMMDDADAWWGRHERGLILASATSSSVPGTTPPTGVYDQTIITNRQE